ncbi:hypothetical protein B0T22DRAFT_453667 [Podospora appendiculata]|uniref:Secreted protein n=1 Tax=Podospora appendiculata TaxID=314037 RepID=A0AAE0XJV7_9PEZI|nr:hypothetical protein B0T22DRAFT_453667 [Podospora appendiculata]
MDGKTRKRTRVGRAAFLSLRCECVTAICLSACRYAPRCPCVRYVYLTVIYRNMGTNPVRGGRNLSLAERDGGGTESWLPARRKQIKS